MSVTSNPTADQPPSGPGEGAGTDAAVPVDPPGRSAARRPTKVALIKPNVVVFPRSLSTYGPLPPVGMAYVAAVLREAGHEVQVVDSVGEAIEQLTDLETPVGTMRRVGLTSAQVVERLDPDTQVVGITHMFLHEWPVVRELAEAVKARLPEATVVVGGENATAFWPWMLEQTDAIDHCVLGEGEATAVALVDRVSAGQPVADLEGVASRRPDGEPAGTGLSVRAKHLDHMPRPAWDLFPVENYLRYADFYGVHRGRSMMVLATRGCPYKCSFCSSPQMWTTRYVVRDPDDVADEIAGYVAHYGVENINFADLTAITKRSWTLRFCDALDERVEGITWQLPVGTRAEALDAEVLQRLWDTGCRNITYAPEAGGERMLEVYQKKVKLSHILESLQAARKVGIVTRVNIIIGHPEERWSDVWRSLTFLVKAAMRGANDAAVMIFGPYPGSADFERLVAEGKVTVDESYYYVALARASGGATSYNPRMRPWQLKVALLSMLIVFYGVGLVFHPRRIVGYLRGLRGRESTAVDQLIRTKRHGFRPLPTDADAEAPSPEPALAGRR